MDEVKSLTIRNYQVHAFHWYIYENYRGNQQETCIQDIIIMLCCREALAFLLI
jgi:hypothetical protein